MILSFSQPVFIPWGGFFCRLMVSQRMVLLDDTLFARGFTFVNRNRVKGPEGETWITVPIKKKGLGRQKIKDLEIYQKEYWGRKFLARLAHLYGKSVCFEQVYDPLARIIQEEGGNFLDMVAPVLESLKECLSIETPFVLQSGLGIEGRGTPLLVKIAEALSAREVVFPYPAQSQVDRRLFEKEGIAVKFLKYTAPVYPQFWGEFISCLSVLDMLFCLGGSSRELLEKSYTFHASGGEGGFFEKSPPSTPQKTFVEENGSGLVSQ